MRNVPTRCQRRFKGSNPYQRESIRPYVTSISSFAQLTSVPQLRAIRNPDFDLWQLPLKQYSGADRDPPYEPPQIPAGAEAYLAERAKHYQYETKVYVGGCHCKAVTFAVLHKPLEEVELVDCACSICTGVSGFRLKCGSHLPLTRAQNGVLWAYPGRHDVFFHPSASSSKPWQPDPSLVTRYTFGKGTNEHVVCNQCFCQIFEARELLDHEDGEGWEEDNGNPGTFGINIALYNDITEYLVESKTGLLKGLLKLTDARDMEPVYQVKV